MHMARLLDPSMLPNQYALSLLSEFYMNDIIAVKDKIITNMRNDPLFEGKAKAKREKILN